MKTIHDQQVKDCTTGNNQFPQGSTNINEEQPYFPALADIKDGRSNTDSWRWMMTNFLPKVDAEARKKMIITNLTTWCTTVSEALVQVLIENSYEAWIEEATVYTREAVDNMTPEEKKAYEKERKIPLYTNNMTAGRKFEGWSEDGIERFNEIFNSVTAQREEEDTGKTLEDSLREYAAAKLDRSGKKRKAAGSGEFKRTIKPKFIMPANLEAI